ncbi:hypothetical protein JOC75_004044 [Metabacillus crassostreae]|uniref:hypothetical protein n=1 Tax=Metabacillus crassostreae TaxID=929098 RepID=UPI0019570FE0|nr:hypothetical protein [Metabacillus crassostreae]MBM7606016.1 hypothetical protein [Metabacillus crassostreae]
MIQYPFWIRIEYLNFSKSKILGYTGSITKERDLIDIIIRLDLELPNIEVFKVNEKDYPLSRLQNIFDKSRHILEEESA